MSAVMHSPISDLEPVRITPGSVTNTSDSARWFAAYTCPRHEKYVRRQLDDRQIESFLPLYRSTQRWKDRRKEVEFALFPGYVFVRIAERDRVRVLDLAGVVSFVSFNGRPAPLHDHEIESLRNGLERGVLAEPHPFLKVGRRVRVVCGPLAGLEGLLVRKKDKVRVVVSLQTIMQSVALEVDAQDVKPC